ncbi:hypothetical protein [Sphingobium phenoxybenzoativorans]|uniref:hypothetical protein n=1 Tax=Sphingobium phenoxybenzoativorans TaxID=1592790 RepID=UPI001FE32F61|nr:hypothetical protein [Sphingobium phenoxybenzoativorans]
MSSDSTPPDLPPTKQAQERAEKAEAAAIRRRWITLGEVLAVAAVVISGLTLWNSWSERADSRAEKAADAKQSSAKAQILVFSTKTSVDGRTLILTPTSEDQLIQSQTVRFPSSFGADPAETTGQSRVEVRWFEVPLKKARENGGMPDDSRGDERVPVAISTRFMVDGVIHDDVAIYDVGYTVRGRLLGGHNVTLRGLSLVSRTKESGLQARLDARWKAIFPQPDK